MSTITQNLVQGYAFTVAMITGLVDPSSRRDERGVVSIEYLVLGAALITIIGFIATNDTVGQALSDAFSALFSKAGS